jgi:hypothetical protein
MTGIRGQSTIWQSMPLRPGKTPVESGSTLRCTGFSRSRVAKGPSSRCPPAMGACRIRPNFAAGLRHRGRRFELELLHVSALFSFFFFFPEKSGEDLHTRSGNPSNMPALHGIHFGRSIAVVLWMSVVSEHLAVFLFRRYADWYVDLADRSRSRSADIDWSGFGVLAIGLLCFRR